MSVTIGTKLGSHELIGLLGKGGMGEVYRARDTKLKREVAIKILPDEFLRDADRLGRFQREAEILASLNHPNIAAIYDLQEANGSRFLVLELVEGETLAERIKRGPIPIEEALHIAKSICEAFEAAHDKGVVHRDLKPANVKITPDGKLKVLDFGLAKAFETEASKANLSQSPTLSVAATNAGVILGTAAYMSPEQAKGRTVDKRTDIFAFGCVLYEMLTGRTAFEGEDLQDILGAVLKSDPDWTRLPIGVSPLIPRLLSLCLQKDAKKRRQTATDVRLDIEQALAEPATATSVAAPTGSTRLAWTMFGVAVLVAVTLAIPAARYLHLTSPPSPPEMRLEINTPPTADPISLAISPDGQKIVFVATFEDRSTLWLRSLNSVSPRPLAGTDGAVLPFWSPDSRSVGFFADSKLKRIDIDGGTVQELANALFGFGGALNRDGTILFAPNGVGSILRISATGGEPAAVTRLEAPQQANHGFPQFLPDSRHFLYYVRGNSEARGVYIGQLGGSEARRLLDADSAAVYVSSGQLLFVRQGTLFAQNFDPVRLNLSGNPSPVAEQVAVNVMYVAALSASAAGPIVYRTGSAGGARQFVWFDRSGKENGRVGRPDSASPRNPSLSPDGRRVALDRNVNGNIDVWLLDTGRDVLSRFTSNTSAEASPIWSPDGSHIVFTSVGNGNGVLEQKLATGAESEEQVLAPSKFVAALDWSPDGHFLLYQSLDSKMAGWDLFALLAGEHKEIPVARTEFDEREGQFSPDGKWIAYSSNQSGRFEIYVQAFPGPGPKLQISTMGGAQVRWRRDGKELFYIALDDQLMAVPIHAGANGQTVEPGTPIPLFTTRVGGAVQPTGKQQYVVSPDGQRFLMNTVTEEAAAPITLLQNWKPSVK